MSERLELTRRGVLQTLLAFMAAVPFTSRGARLPLDAPDALAAELLDGDERRVVVHTCGTKLDRFLRSRGIKPAHLAQASGYSRQHLFRLRTGKMEPTRRCMVHLTHAARTLTREPVHAGDLFDLTAVDARSIARWERAGRTRAEREE